MATPAVPAYPRPVRVCIVGAGAIGGLLATRLAVAGEEVSVFARGETLAAIRDTGLTVIEPDGSVVVAPAVEASDDLGRLRPAGRRRPVVEGAPDRRGRRSAGGAVRRGHDRRPGPERRALVVLPEAARAVRGSADPVARPGRHHRAPHPGRPDHRLHRLPRGRAGGARRHPPRRGRPVPGRRARRVEDRSGSPRSAQTPHRAPASRRGSSPTSGPTSGSRPGATSRSTRSAPSPGRRSPRSASSRPPASWRRR